MVVVAVLRVMIYSLQNTQHTYVLRSPVLQWRLVHTYYIPHCNDHVGPTEFLIVLYRSHQNDCYRSLKVQIRSSHNELS